MAPTARPSSDDVLMEALEEIREMNKFTPEAQSDGKCKLCLRANCDCQVRNLFVDPYAVFED